MLGSFIVQADLGDWEPEEHGEGIGYIRDIPFAPDQSVELLEKIAELHKDRKYVLQGTMLRLFVSGVMCLCIMN